MQTQPRDLRPTPGHSSAQPTVRGRRLRDYIRPINLDDTECRALRARARFTWSLTDKGLGTPDCRYAAWVFSPVSWKLMGS